MKTHKKAPHICIYVYVHNIQTYIYICAFSEMCDPDVDDAVVAVQKGTRNKIRVVYEN